MINCLSATGAGTRGAAMADSPAHLAADLRQPASRQASRNLRRKQGICNDQDESSGSVGQRNDEPSKKQEHSEEDEAKDEAAVKQHTGQHSTDEYKVVTLQNSRDKIQDEELSREL